MSVFNNKKVVLAVTGGIAAYKTTFLVRLLIKKGAKVKVIMTPNATQFVTPLTLSTLSKNPVYSEFSKDNEEWNNHVDLALWADILLIAPATANTLSKMADGNCDNLVLATYLSAKCLVYFAPAMDLDMYQHPSTKTNLATLEKNGNICIPSTFGELASGLIGEGRMEQPENIVAFIEKHLLDQLSLKGKTVLITAGPTYELLDPVRFIGNFSSGKMGFEIAKEAERLGATVQLITGPTHENCNGFDIERTNVVSAKDMLDAVQERFSDATIVIMSAAVADYRPSHQENQKIKKKGDSMTLELTKTTDILHLLGQQKTQQFLVGFALETQNEEANALAKLDRKNLDLIVLNSLNDKDAGFKTDTNKITILGSDYKQAFDLKSKEEVAKDILKTILERIQ